MTKHLVGLIVVSVGVMVEAATGAEPGQAISLFNGKDLTGWNAVLADEKAKAEDVWSVKDGVLSCKGEPRGYIRTEKEFENYVLKLQWRFPAGTKGGNSGVLLHTPRPGRSASGRSRSRRSSIT